jgi:hypothetical protein
MPLNSWLRQHLSKRLLQRPGQEGRKIKESMGDDMEEVMGKTYAGEVGALTEAEKKKLQPKKKSMLSFLRRD